MERIKKYIFISGPYTKGDVGHNVHNFLWTAETLMREGYIVFNPILLYFQDISFPITYEDWMIQDLAWLEKCDAVLRIPGESKGADLECNKAKALGIPVYNTIDDLKNS